MKPGKSQDNKVKIYDLMHYCWRGSGQLLRKMLSHLFYTLGKVQINVTVPPHQQGPTLSCFAALSNWLPVATDPTRKVRPCHAERSEASRRRWRETLRFAQGDMVRLVNLSRTLLHL